MKCRECNTIYSDTWIYLSGNNVYFCIKCMPSMQPERLKRVGAERLSESPNSEGNSERGE